MFLTLPIRKKLIRQTYIFHRWCGILLGLMMVAWCLSGMVMLWHPWPQPDPSRASRSHPVLHFSMPVETNWLRGQIRSARIIMAGDVPVIELARTTGETHISRLSDGHASIADPVQLGRNARLYSPDPSNPEPDFQGVHYLDQWIVNTKGHLSGLYCYALHDKDDTLVWLSPGAGDIVQAVTRWERMWCWFGAIPH